MTVTWVPYSSIPTTTALVAIGTATVTATSAIAWSIVATNFATTNDTPRVDFARYDGSTSYYVMRNVPIIPGGSVICPNQAMASGYQMRVAVTATTVAVTMSLANIS